MADLNKIMDETEPEHVSDTILVSAENETETGNPGVILVFFIYA